MLRNGLLNKTIRHKTFFTETLKQIEGAYTKIIKIS